MLIDILRDDGAIVRRDGPRVRAATNCEVGSEGDRFVELVYFTGPQDLRLKPGRLRAGTLRLGRDGTTFSVLDALRAQGYSLLADGRIARPGEAPAPLHWYGEPPRPEDYILAKSGLTEADLDDAGEEAAMPGAAAPPAIGLPGGWTPEPVAEPRTLSAAAAVEASAPGPRNRRERRRQKAQARKRAGETQH